MGAYGHSLQFAQSSTIVHFCGLLGPFLRGELSSQNDDNRRQSWTIVDKYLKPPFAKPPFRLSRELLTLGRLAVLKTLEISGKSSNINNFRLATSWTLTLTVPHDVLSSNCLWHIFGSDIWPALQKTLVDFFSLVCLGILH